MNSSGSARTTIDESANATATETASAISRIRAWFGGIGFEAMAASLCGLPELDRAPGLKDQDGL